MKSSCWHRVLEQPFIMRMTGSKTILLPRRISRRLPVTTTTTTTTTNNINTPSGADGDKNNSNNNNNSNNRKKMSERDLFGLLNVFVFAYLMFISHQTMYLHFWKRTNNNDDVSFLFTTETTAATTTTTTTTTTLNSLLRTTTTTTAMKDNDEDDEDSNNEAEVNEAEMNLGGNDNIDNNDSLLDVISKNTKKNNSSNKKKKKDGDDEYRNKLLALMTTVLEGYQYLRSDVPFWMQKSIFHKELVIAAAAAAASNNNNNNENGITTTTAATTTTSRVPDDQRVCFVHVGKTAGTTLACYLGFMYNNCVGIVPPASGLLPKYTTNVIHTHYDDCTSTSFGYYLFVVRNPIHRIQSWFTYELPMNSIERGDSQVRQHKQQRLFNTCNYTSLNDLAERGLQRDDDDDDDNNNNNNNKNDKTPLDILCQYRAKMAIAGEVGYSTHNYYNYRYYLNEIEKTSSSSTQPSDDDDDDSKQRKNKKKKSLVAIRTEHIEDDWRSIEENVLHGSMENVTITKSKKTNESPKRQSDLYLSEIAKQRLCYALCAEIQAYKEILHRSVNLNAQQIEVSLNEVRTYCPIETDLASCQ